MHLERIWACAAPTSRKPSRSWEVLQRVSLAIPAGFQFPVTLTMWHMLFCSVAAAALVRLGYVAPSEGMNQEVHRQSQLPCHLSCLGWPRCLLSTA